MAPKQSDRSFYEAMAQHHGAPRKSEHPAHKATCLNETVAQRHGAPSRQSRNTPPRSSFNEAVAQRHGARGGVDSSAWPLSRQRHGAPRARLMVSCCRTSFNETVAHATEHRQCLSNLTSAPSPNTAEHVVDGDRCVELCAASMGPWLNTTEHRRYTANPARLLTGFNETMVQHHGAPAYAETRHARGVVKLQ